MTSQTSEGEGSAELAGLEKNTNSVLKRVLKNKRIQKHSHTGLARASQRSPENPWQIYLRMPIEWHEL